ncbi:hypothetical protein HANVADRAFT_91137 [Hanseniaspora valbyensis NRRL Y-1626]|uniref:Uncharacterized protein n=1 Tax=Hanseniaspora valbyensis NRRL Y-1626 TaxID=766949 RepID=A0A1B7T8H2_9ASCO|nr:hypothetical protein HANVADRAFT_91137 [Hanseniaspora valbyensis NRRL Y-1626]
MGSNFFFFFSSTFMIIYLFFLSPLKINFIKFNNNIYTFFFVCLLLSHDFLNLFTFIIQIFFYIFLNVFIF